MAVIRAPTSWLDAVAVQISATPFCDPARWINDHVKPAPETPSFCMFAAGGPSDDAKATSSSPGPAVSNAGVVIAPAPSTETVVSTLNGLDAGGPEETTSATALPLATWAPPIGF